MRESLYDSWQKVRSSEEEAQEAKEASSQSQLMFMFGYLLMQMAAFSSPASQAATRRYERPSTKFKVM